MILKGPDVRARTLVIPHVLPELSLPLRGGSTEASLAAAAGHELEQIKHQAEREAQALRERALAEAQAEAAKLLAKARAEAERLTAQAAAQAQVELGRAKAEAEQLVEQARLRLEEAGEVITTLAEARQIMAEHQADAAALVAEAEAQRQSVFDEARSSGRDEGHASGYAAGAQAARDELATELELAHAVAAQAKVDRETLIAAAEPDIVRLAMEVTRKLIAREVETDPDIVKGLVTRAMLKAAGDGPIRLRLHPDTIARLGTYLSDVSSRFAARGVEVVPDPTIEPAGAIIDTRTGSVDARLSMQLAKVESTLLTLTGESA